MTFEPTPLPDVWVVTLEAIRDERGWFARTFDADWFRARGLDPAVVQCNISHNPHRDTLRGMHYQSDPYGESKLVHCVRGTIYDVTVDLRQDSPTYCQWFAAELSCENGRLLYIGTGLAHGFQTLTDDSDVLYQMGHEYVPRATAGVRWDDPTFGIEWPEPSTERLISQADRTWPDFRP